MTGLPAYRGVMSRSPIARWRAAHVTNRRRGVRPPIPGWRATEGALLTRFARINHLDWRRLIRGDQEGRGDARACRLRQRQKGAPRSIPLHDGADAGPVWGVVRGASSRAVPPTISRLPGRILLGETLELRERDGLAVR